MIYTFYGRPKVGKTTLSVSDPLKNVVVFDADRGLIGVDTTRVTAISDMSMSNLEKAISKGIHRQADRLVVDTGTQLYTRLLLEVSGGRTPTLQARSTVASFFSWMLQEFRESQAEIVLTFHEKVVAPKVDWESGDAEEEEEVQVSPDATQGVLKTVMAMSDVIGRLYVAGKTPPVRRLWLAPSPSIVAGARSKTYHGDPPFLEDPTMSKVTKLLNWN